MRWLAIPALALVLAAGCSSDGGETPRACLGEGAYYLAALERAPDPVRLSGATPISDCLTSSQGAGELNTVGTAALGAARALNRRARRRPGGAETTSLGYLVGAVQRGASRTGGIHADLVRRLDEAARFNRGRAFGVGFERAFGRGYAAGRRGG